MNKWIKCSDRLPEYSGYYLVAYTSSSKSVTKAYFSDIDNNFKHVQTRNVFKTVNYWMPLPEPPKK